jgi:hypothetical protein
MMPTRWQGETACLTLGGSLGLSLATIDGPQQGEDVLSVRLWLIEFSAIQEELRALSQDDLCQ